VSRVQKLREEHEVAVKVAELEDRLVELKAAQPRCKGCGRREGEQSAELVAVKEELRALRYVLRLGRQDDPESVAALAALKQLSKGA
jgi:hypothetical protein